MRTILPINQNWLYKPSFFSEKDLQPALATGEDYTAIGLPHTNIELPFNYFDDKAFQFTSCYKRALPLDSSWAGQRIFVDFEGVMAYAKVYVNGVFAGEHKGGYTPFSIEVTNLVAFDRQNEMTVVVDSSERADIPPFGGQIDYLTYGGIYREVQLRVVPNTFIENLFVTTPNALADVKQLQVQVLLEGITKGPHYDIELLLTDKAGNTLATKKQSLPQSHPFVLELNELKDIKLWSVSHPNLYHVLCVLFENGKEIDRCQVRTGFRDVQFTAEGFYLNGEKIKLMGLNRHQAFPYVGYAMPKRAQQKDADIMKYELGLNTVRTSHYPQSRHFLDRCDEIGLLVFEEIPGWQYIGDRQWQDQVLQDVEKMVVTDRNHPSIYIWGVRINESQDHHNLYTRTNALARQLDPTRPTGGVRYLTNSDFLEDVYTMNDFIHDNGYNQYLSTVIRNYTTYDNTQDKDGKAIALRDPKAVTGLGRPVPYMVTEYNGHMYPTKRFDQEERTMEHALRHARVQNASYGNEAIAGAIGWCAFDYNTHSDFGSGDKICYHGVMDMFRIPKLAAYAYKSQIPPQEEAVLQPATYWARGERSIGGVIPLTIFTNCDKVDFYYGNELKGSFTPDKENFPFLPHPPIVIDQMAGEWGMRWEGAAFVGYVNGKEVIRKEYSSNAQPTHFSLLPDDTALAQGDWDTTRVVVQVTDQFNNPMPFLMEGLDVQVEGAGQLIGPGSLSLIGGQTAFWIKTKGETGIIHLQVTCPALHFTAQKDIHVL